MAIGVTELTNAFTFFLTFSLLLLQLVSTRAFSTSSNKILSRDFTSVEIFLQNVPSDPVGEPETEVELRLES